MSNTQCALLGLASWHVLVLFLLAGFRLYTSITQKKAANTFAPDGSDVPGFGQRLVRVHANCYENIPLYLALLLFALVSNQTAVTDPTAMILLGARVGAERGAHDIHQPAGGAAALHAVPGAGADGGVLAVPVPCLTSPLPWVRLQPNVRA